MPIVSSPPDRDTDDFLVMGSGRMQFPLNDPGDTFIGHNPRDPGSSCFTDHGDFMFPKNVLQDPLLERKEGRRMAN